MWIECDPALRPSKATRNGTIPPSGYRELLPLRLPFCQALSELAHWSRLTPTPARTGATDVTSAVATATAATATVSEERRTILDPRQDDGPTASVRPRAPMSSSEGVPCARPDATGGHLRAP